MQAFGWTCLTSALRFSCRWSRRANWTWRWASLPAPRAFAGRCFLRFPLTVIRPETDQDLKRGSMTWSALKGETLISLQPASPIQQLVDRNLSQAGITLAHNMHVNLLDTQIAMVEAGESIAVVPSYALLASRGRRVVISRLINPVAELEFSLISYRGKKLPSVALEFTDFLKSYFSRWASHANYP